MEVRKSVLLRLLGTVSVVAFWFQPYRPPKYAAAIFAEMVSLSYMTYFHNSIPYAAWSKDMKYGSSQNGPIVNPFDEAGDFDPEDDYHTRVCKLSMYLKFAEELHSGIIITPLSSRDITLPPPERISAYVEACREVLQGLPPESEQRKILESLNPVPRPWQFHLNLTHPWMTGRWTEEMFGGYMSVFQRAPGPSFPNGEDDGWRKEREETFAKMPDITARAKSDEELLRTLPPEIVEGLKSLSIRPVKDETVDVKDIPKAMREGRTVVFDATKLCGKEIFNLTVPDIARLHGEQAHRIPAFKLNSARDGDGTFDTLAELGHRFQTWNDMGQQDYPGFGPFHNSNEAWAREVAQTPSDFFLQFMEMVSAVVEGRPVEKIRGRHVESWKAYRQMNTQTTINVKRLPNFPLKNMYEAMGSPSWIERLWSLLWIGPVGDFWHFDEEDNLLIGVSGNIYIAVMEQNLTDIISGTRNIGLGFNDLIGFFHHTASHDKSSQVHWVDQNPWIRKVPIHLFKLEPGMGITVPSRAYHNVMALDGNRVLMNCFMLPRYKALLRDPVNMHSWYSPGRQDDKFLALWHLKAAALGRLWDTKRVGGFFAGYKLEFM